MSYIMGVYKRGEGRGREGCNRVALIGGVWSKRKRGMGCLIDLGMGQIHLISVTVRSREREDLEGGGLAFLN